MTLLKYPLLFAQLALACLVHCLNHCFVHEVPSILTYEVRDEMDYLFMFKKINKRAQEFKEVSPGLE